MRVLVCGSREWTDYNKIFSTLSGIRPIECVIEGECRGADRLGAAAARELGIPVLRFPAKWQEYGAAAGPLRNSQMLQEGKPDLVLAFHHCLDASAGTKDMVCKAKAAGVEVRVIT